MKHAIYEQALTKCGVEFEYVEQIPADEINHTRGRQMQARLQPLDHDLIDSYAVMIAEGFTPPPLLLWKHGKSLPVPLDGNQRIAANQQVPAKKRLKHFSAYVVKTDDLMVVDRLCWSFNNMVNGRRLSYEECLEHALTFVRKYGQTITAAAKEWGVKEWELQKRVTDAEMTELAESAGIKLPASLDKKVLAIISQIRKFGDDVVLRTMKAVAENGTSQTEAEELVRSISRAKSLETKMEAINSFINQDSTKQRRAETQNGRSIPIKLPRHQLQQLLDRVEEVLDRYKDKKAFAPVGKEDWQRYSDAARKIANHLISIYGLGALLNGE